MAYEASGSIDSNLQAGPYRIGSVGRLLLRGLVRRLREERPDALVTTHTSAHAEELTGMVLGGSLDVAIIGVCGDAPPPVPGLVWRVVAVEAVAVLLPDWHPFADRTEVDLADLAECHWVVSPGDGCFSECFAKACAEVGFVPRRFEGMDTRTAIDRVVAGRAVALGKPTMCVPGVVPVQLAGVPLRWRHLLGWHPLAASASLGPRLARHTARAHADAVRGSHRYLAWLRQNPWFEGLHVAA